MTTLPIDWKHTGSDLKAPMPETTHHRGGFTLLEILMAILLFSIVIGTIVSAYFTLFSKADSLQASLDNTNLLNQTLKRMQTDIKSIYISLPPFYRTPNANDPPDDHRVVGDLVFINGQNYGRLRFTSFEHLPMEGSHRMGIAEIIFYVHKTERDGLVLRRADHLQPYPEFSVSDRDPALAKNLHSLEFSYYDHEGNTYDKWDSELEAFDFATPRLIEIKIGLGEDPNPKSMQIKVAPPVFRNPKK